MPSTLELLHLAAGLLAGAALAWFHGWATHRAAERALEDGSALRLLIGFPLRVGLPAAGLFALSLLGLWALIGGMASFLIGQGLLRRKLNSSS
jgi:hypothetical protein